VLFADLGLIDDAGYIFNHRVHRAAGGRLWENVPRDLML
jgi:hypothetical protein